MFFEIWRFEKTNHTFWKKATFSNTSALRRWWRRARERISKYIVWMFCWQKKRAKLKERKLLCVSLSGLSPSVSNKQTLLLYTLVYIIVLCCFIHEHIRNWLKGLKSVSTLTTLINREDRIFTKFFYFEKS